MNKLDYIYGTKKYQTQHFVFVLLKVRENIFHILLETNAKESRYKLSCTIVRMYNIVSDAINTNCTLLSKCHMK